MIVTDSTTKMQKICFVCTVTESNVLTGILPENIILAQELFLNRLFYFCELIKTMVSMKKIAVILVVCFITALAVSSCNEKSCPAYADAEASQTSSIG